MPCVQAKRNPYKFEAWHEQKVGVPMNGVWFSSLLLMLSKAPPEYFLVAWDTPPNKHNPNGGKCFGYYETPNQCYEELSKNKLNCCYEVFVHVPDTAGDNCHKYSEYSARSPTLAYGDWEWYGEKDTDHVCAREILRRIFHVCETKLNFTPEVYVLCSTRKDIDKDGVWRGVWKNSYHFIITNLYAEKCAHIKQLFMPETLRNGVDDDLKEYDASVYATGQQLRMPLCAKRGSDVILRRINKNPSDPEDTLTTHFEDDDFDAILPALVTVVDKNKPTMHLLKPWFLVPKPDPTSLPSAGAKRKAAPASLDSPTRDVRQRTGTPSESAGAVADLLVAMHPDQVGHGYESFRDVVFGATNAAGNSPDVVKILKEWTRIRIKADHRDQEWPRIANGTFASEPGEGDGTTITMCSLIHWQKQYPAACTFPRAVNADPLPNCRALLASEDVWMFDLFLKFLRHVNYQKTSWKWVVQFGYYIVPMLKDQVYNTIQGGYAGITNDDFDLVWDGGQHCEIFGYACKRYLEDIVGQINAYIPPLVETTAGKPDGEATADGTSNPQEAVTTVGHVRTSKPKARAGAPKRFTKKEVVTLIVKTSASVHSLEAREVLRNAIHGALAGQKDADKDTEELLGLWALLQGKSSKTGTGCK
jgi:hypothetical protein